MAQRGNPPGDVQICLVSDARCELLQNHRKFQEPVGHINKLSGGNDGPVSRNGIACLGAPDVVSEATLNCTRKELREA